MTINRFYGYNEALLVKPIYVSRAFIPPCNLKLRTKRGKVDHSRTSHIHFIVYRNPSDLFVCFAFKLTKPSVNMHSKKPN